MARREIVVVTCDLCQTAGAEAAAFSVDRSSFEIDFCTQHRAEFSSALGTYISHARGARNGGTIRRSGSGTAHRDPGRNDAIRRWAKDNGFGIGDRGRIAAHIETAYNQAAK